ncbi:MAG: hypothetical protein AAF465_02405 [Pseudomonadota bacterium]
MLRLTLLWIGAFLCSSSGAHGTPDNHLVMVVADRQIKLSMVLGEQALMIADVDQDGHVALHEMRASSATLNAYFNRVIRVSDERGEQGRVRFADLTTDLDHVAANDDRVDHARLVRTLDFDRALVAITLDVTLLARAIDGMRVTVIDANSGQKSRLSGLRTFQTIRLPIDQQESRSP